MNFLYWNVRGFGNPDTKSYLSHKPSIIFGGANGHRFHLGIGIALVLLNIVSHL